MNTVTFTSMADFATALRKLKTAVKPSVVASLRDVGEVVLEEARDSIGEYQDGAGPFAPWAPLADSTQEDRIRLGFTPDDPLLREGKLYGSYEMDFGKQTQDVVEMGVGSELPQALGLELGGAYNGAAPNAPPRSVLGRAFVVTEDRTFRMFSNRLISRLMKAIL